MKQKNSYFFIFSFILASGAYAEDARQFLPDSKEASEDVKESFQSRENTSFIPEDAPALDINKADAKEKSIAIPFPETNPELEKPATYREELHSTGVQVLGQEKNQKDYLDFSTKDLLNKMKYQGENALSLSFFYNSYEYQNRDGTGAFERTYQSEKSSDFPFFIRASMHHYFVKGAFHLGAGLGLAAGRNSGYGFFKSTGQRSDARFTLWTVPLDLSLLLEFPLAGWAKLGIAGGPSVVGIQEKRSDFASSNKKSSLHQMSYGYFASAHLAFSLHKLAPKASYKFYSDYEITNYFFTLDVRAQSYENFKSKDIKINGISAGIGLIFEYL